MANLGVSWLVVWILPAFGVIPPLPDYGQFWLLMALGAVVFLPATLLTPPEKMDHLVHYYVQTRPLGWWGPVQREAERRGLIAPQTKREQVGGRPLIRRTWTPEEAEDWSREDWMAIVLSPIVYALIIIGVARLLLGQLDGALITLGAIAGGFILYWIIDPKLRAVSVEYEAKQARYLEELERSVRWDQRALDATAEG
jgi:hypothetical protein